jgi:branched-chain amino acid aminotransferase
MIVWADGRIVAPDEPVATALDHGMLVGDGIFESVRVDGGTAFELERYLERLRRSAVAVGLDALDLDRVRAGVHAVLAHDLPDPARLRITVTTGPGPLGTTRGGGPPFVTVIAAPLVAPRPSATVVTAAWPRNEHSPLAGVKSTSYADNVLALASAHSQGADEAIFTNTAGNLCEGTGSNVFVGIGGRLYTPPLAAGCLAGVTREIVCELVEVVEEPVPGDALVHADEAFLTSTTRRVQPIATVDRTPLPRCPGPLTERAAAALAAYMTPTSG